MFVSPKDILFAAPNAFLKWNFPGRLVDGKHIRMKCPSSLWSTHYSCQNYYSVFWVQLTHGGAYALWLVLGSIDSTSYSSLCNNPRSTIHLLLNQNTRNKWGLLQFGVSWSWCQKSSSSRCDYKRWSRNGRRRGLGSVEKALPNKKAHLKLKVHLKLVNRTENSDWLNGEVTYPPECFEIS